MLIGVIEIIQKTFELYKKNAHLFLQYLLVLLIPTGITSIMGAVIENVLMRDNFPTGGAILGLYLFINLAAWVASFWLYITLTRIIYKKYTDATVGNIKAELQNTGHLVLPAVIVSILTSLMIFFGFILFIIPGIIFSVWFAFSLFNVIIKEQKPTKAIKSSLALVKGRWWAVLWRLVAPILILGFAMILINFVVTAPLIFFLNLAKEGSGISFFLNIIATLIMNFIGLIFVPLTSGATVVLYSELQKNTLTPKH